MKSASVYDESPVYAIIKTLSVPSLRPAALRCIRSIFFNFFFLQFLATWLPGRIPVSKVDHPLDQKIPFVPAWVVMYLDLTFFWVRMLSFLLRAYGRRAFDAVRGFLTSISKLYAFAAEVYQKSFSTTDRPFYITHPRFFLIHLVDPHLMCIPSLHVMVVIWTYTRFAAMLRSLSEAEHCAAQIEEMKQGALATIKTILYVKQHSINCVAAGMYAMTRFDETMFPPEEAEAFTALLFGDPPKASYGSPAFYGSPAPYGSPPTAVPGNRPLKNHNLRPFATPRTKLPAADVAEIKAHILSLYRLFLEEGKTVHNWVEPLLGFMRGMPKA